MGESASKITLAETVDVFDEAAPGTPLTASEVAEELGCVRRTAYGKLERLAERGDLRTKKVGARGRIWWRADPQPTAIDQTGSDALGRAQLDEFVDEVTDYAIFLLDPDGTVKTWNEGARRIKGYEETEIIGEHFSEFYTEADREADVPGQNLAAAAEEGRIEDEGHRLRQDGSTFWANVVITALYDDDDLQGFVKVTRDMTERHEYEERLRTEKERFEALVEEVEDYAIFLLDPDGTVRTWNRGAKEIKGYEETEIIGEHFSEFYTEADREADVPEQNLAAAAEEGRTEDEGRRVRKDGSTFWANVVITALHDDDGSVRGYAKVTRDMTERHEYEERLRKQRDELDELNQINAVIRGIDRSLVAATTRDEIFRDVCERLAASETYDGAWVGEYSEGYEAVDPRAWDGVSDGYVEAIRDAEVNRDDLPERDGGATALRTESVQSITRIRGDDKSEPWQERTLDEGFESAVMLPLMYEGVEYGVLTVYATSESAFDDRKIEVLTELGETISHAVASIRRKERERALTALQTSFRDLLHTESPAQIGDVIVDAVTEDLGLADALVYRFDTSRNVLEPVSASFPLESYDGGPQALAGGDDSAVWTGFVDGEPRTVDASSSPAVPTTGLEKRESVAIPLGDHGVLVAATDPGETFDENTRNLVDIVGTTAEAAFDRVESQANLRERDEILQERNQRLKRLNQINTIIREVDQALVQASTREEVQRVVCEQLTDSDRFQFAWIGQTEDAGEGLTARAWSGDGRGYLDSVDLRDGGTEPAVQTARTDEVTVVSNVADDLRSGRWRKEAFRREFQSVISVPLAHDSITHGVLAVYADRPEVFDEMERTVFAELGGTIANSLNAVDTRQSLLSDERVELEFELRDESTSFLSRFSDDVGGTVAFEGFVPLSEGRARLFFTVKGTDPDDVRSVIDRSVAVESGQLLASYGDEHLYETVVGGTVIPVTLMERGASLRSLTVSEDGIRLGVGLPSNEDVRGFIERFQAEYESAELLARRRRERSADTRQGFAAALEERLTDRQLEVLQTAYFAGFFASPRRSTGSDVAELLDVSQPTVAEHLRTAQSRLLDLLLRDRSLEE